MANILSTIGGDILGALPIPGAKALGAGLSSGIVDPTPNASLQNVLTTQGKKVFSNAPAPSAPKPTPTYQADTGGGSAGGSGGSQTSQAADYWNPYTGSYSSTPPPSAADYQAQQDALAQIDQGLQGANDSLGRLDSQQQTGLGNVDKNFQQAYQTLLGQQQVADRNYNTNRTGQLNDYLGVKDQNATTARSWLDNATRILGAQGAGGGSAARYGVVNEANGMLQGSNSQATATNNKNIIALDTAHGDDANKFSNGFQDLNNQKQQNTQDLQSKIANERVQLLNTIGQLTGQKNIANGGDYKTAMAASSPFLAQIPGLQNTIDSLAATPAITPQQVQVSNPNLAGYNWAAAPAPVVPQQDATIQNNNVPIVPIDQQQKDKQNPILSLFGLDPNQLQFVQ